MQIYINNTQIEIVESYIYLGQRYSTRDKTKEIQRRITAGWTAFAKHRDIFKGNNWNMLEETRLQLTCVLPAMTYGAEIWAFITQAKNNLAAAKTKMERNMLNITYRDRKTNIWGRKKTKVTDVIKQVKRRKWIPHNRWTLRITN